MKSLINGILYVVVIVIFSGCVKPNPPTWYMQNHEGGKLIGRGQGTTFEDAKKGALSDLTSSIGSNIDTQYISKTSVYKNSYEYDKKHFVGIENILKELVDIGTSKYTVEKTLWTTSHFVEVTISQSALVSVLNSSVLKNMAWLRSIEYEKCLSAKERYKIRDVIFQTNSYLAMIQTYSPKENVENLYKELSEYSRIANKKIKVKVTADDQHVMRAFMPILAENEIEVTKGQGDGIIQLETVNEKHIEEQRNTRILPIYLSLLRTNIHFENSCGMILFEGKIDVVDQAKTAVAAKENSIRKFVRKLRDSQFHQALKRL